MTRRSMHPGPRPDSTARSRIEAAGGLVAERFAFCQTMPLDEFLTTAEELGKSGYRPVRFRPYADGRGVRVAAVWTRDGRKWRHGSRSDRRTKSSQTGRREPARRDCLPVDVAGYVTTGADGKPADRYAALWVEKAGPDDDARMYVAVRPPSCQKAQDRLKDARHGPRHSAGASQDADGRASYCGIWRKSAAYGGFRR